jgi:hypothetical protein
MKRGRGRPKFELNDKEAKVLRSIAEAKKAEHLWAVMRERRVNGKLDRRVFGEALVAVHHALAKKGCKGLFTKWLTVRAIPYSFAFDQMGRIDGSGIKPTAQRPSAIRKRRVMGYLADIRSNEDQQAKLVLFESLCQYIRKQWNITAHGELKY